MSIVLFIAILAVLVFIHEAGHFLAAKKSGVKVEEFGFGFPPRLFGVKKGETLYSINLIPLGGFVRLYQEEYHEEPDGKKGKKKDKISKERAFIYKKPWQKAFIIVAGILGNFLLGWVIISYLFTQGVPVPLEKVMVEKIQSGSPAATAGLRENDQIATIIEGGKTYPIKSTQNLIEYSQKFSGREVTLEIIRNNERVLVALIPRKDPPGGQGPLGVIINTPTVTKKYNIVEAPFMGLLETSNRTKQIIEGLFKTLGELGRFQKPSADVAGPIGIARLTGQVASYGVNTVLEFIAILSLNLAVINILPFPALDGGRLAFVAYEWVTRKRINKSIEQYANVIGMVILLSLALLVSINDVIKIFRP